MDDERLYAVISGDIVGSRRFMEKGTALADTIRESYAECAKAFREALVGPKGPRPVDIFAGDSWQVLVNSPGPALRVALCVRALIKSREDLPKADTRLAIGIGTVETVNDEDVSEGQGQAFGLSGEALDRLQDEKVRMAALVPQEWVDRSGMLDIQDTLDTIATLVDRICQDWKPQQAAATARALMGLEQVRIGEELAVSQSAVSQALNSVRWPAVEQAVGWWENWLSKCAAATSPVR